MTATYDVINPATERVVQTVELADAAATDRAIERAAQAYEIWRHVAPADRAKLLRAFAEQVDRAVPYHPRGLIGCSEILSSSLTEGDPRVRVRVVTTYVL